MNNSATPTTQEQLSQYASLVWASGDLVEVRCIHADRESGKAPSSLWVRASDLPLRNEHLEALNGDGYGIYAGLLPRKAEGGRLDMDALPGRVVWADFDGVDPREAWRMATDKGMPKPTMVVNSGHGTHLYWTLDNPAEPLPLAALVGDVAARIGSDRTVKNPSRILRLPGFTNTKPPAAPCVLVYVDDSGIRYDFDELRRLVPKAAPVQPPAPAAVPVPTGSREIDRARAYLEKIEHAAQGNRNASAFRVACVLRNDYALPESVAWALLCDWNLGNTPPLGEPELRATFESGFKYAKQPRGGKLNAERPMPPCTPSAPAPAIPTTDDEDDLSDMRRELDAQRTGERRTLSLPWSRLSHLSHALKPGTVCIVAGPPCTGKSFFAAHIATAVHAAEVPWRYLPLEDRKVDFKWRLLAMLARDYRMIDDDAEHAGLRADTLDRYASTLADIAPHVCENPRLGHRDEQGKMVVPPLPHQSVIDWMGQAFMSGARVVFVDPISQIEFDQREQWKAEGDFMRSTIALVNEWGGTVVFVAHTAKRGGKSASLPLTLEDIQGSAMFGRLCHTAILLDAHDLKESAVMRTGGLTEVVEHNRTVLIAKARNAQGTRQRLAFRQSDTAPEFEELGVIAPKHVTVTADDEHYANRV